MKKLESLRNFLADSIPELKRDAESLTVFANTGTVISTITPSLSFVYRYKAECAIFDYSGSADSIMVPLLLWIRTNQPELLMNGEESIGFEAELLNKDTADISITLNLSERVKVQMVDGKAVVTHLDEPPLPDLTGPVDWTMYDGAEVVTQ